MDCYRARVVEDVPPELARVRKLLALAGSSNPHEAAVAAARAQALIEAHRLEGWLRAARDAAADPDPIVDARDTPLSRARRLRKWKVALAVTLAELNECAAYTLCAGQEEAIVLIGRGRDRAAVAELWGWLVTRIEWLSATHGAGKPHAWHEAFRIGVVDAVAQRLQVASDEVVASQASAALVRVDPARAAHREALARFVAERLGPSRGRALRVDAAAWRRGRRAAHDLALPGRGPADD